MSAYAQFALAASGGIIEHGTYTVGAPGGGPTFNVNGFMTNPGGGYPTVVAPAIVNSLGPAVVPVLPGALNLATPAAGAFGGAATRMSAGGGGQAGLWWTNNWIRDNPANVATGSYNASGGNVTYNNISGINLFGNAGVFMPGRGFINQNAGNNVNAAQSLLGRFVIRNAANAIIQDFILGSLFRTDGTGPLAEAVLLDGSSSVGAYAPVGFWGYNQTVIGMNTSYRMYGSALQAVMIPIGGSIEVRGRWTMLADPDSGIDYDDDWASEWGNINHEMPDFGYNAVPEPATMTALGLGLLALASKRRSKKA